MSSLPYNDYGTWIRSQFPFRVQKISIDAGFSCPNRDGRAGLGGCIYCDNRTFNPSYCNRKRSITEQLEDGKRFFARKYPDMKYLAYFQAYTNTYASVETLKEMYEEALGVDGIVGIVIGTRPDCMPDELLDYLTELNRQTFLIVEYGIESANDNTLRLINRGHTFECSRQTVERTSERGIITGGHIHRRTAGRGCRRDCQTSKSHVGNEARHSEIHQMQIIKGTELARMYIEKPFHIYTVDEYMSTIAEYIQWIREDIVIERFVSQSPKDMLIAPQWGLKNYEFTNLLTNHLRKTGTRQGCKIITE